MGLEEKQYSAIQIIHKLKDKQTQLNLYNCDPTVTVISRTFSGIRFHVNSVIDIGVTLLYNLPTNLINAVCSTTERGMYNYAHIRIISYSKFNCLRDFGTYGFTECVNA